MVIDDNALEKVTGGVLTENATLVMQNAMIMAQQQGMSKAEAINMIKTEWANKNPLLSIVTTDFCNDDLNACLTYIENNWA
jgi:uncharacterized protein YbdZ (MbtH family)